MATVASLKEKYAAERAKRVRPEMQAQYVDTREAEFPATLAADPWIDRAALAAQRPPVADGGEVKFLILGAGHNGLLFGYRLVEAGFSVYDMCIVDVAGGFGGTWYWNRYPGLMCDVEGYTYMPLVEEVGYRPLHRYSYGQEIRGQSERIARRTGLDERALFGTHVDAQTWDAGKGRWRVELTRDFGEFGGGKKKVTVYAQYVLSASGVFPMPKVPRLPGLAEIVAGEKVKVLHTSRWDWDFTGGSQEVQDMVNLRDKRVAVVGTGATAVQVVPAVAKWAKHLFVVQRTPSYCGPRGQRETDPAYWKTEVATKRGWQKERQINFNQMITDEEPYLGKDLVNDGWTHTPAGSGLVGSRRKGNVTQEMVPAHIDELVERDIPRTTYVREHIAKTVKDPETARKLTPWYPSWCKRPTFHDEYLEAFNRENVTLVDTDGKGMTGYTTEGIVVNGAELPVDVLILATGFTSSTSLDITEKMGARVTGADGRDLGEAWTAKDFLSPLMGVAMRDFPNMFWYASAGGGASYNMTSAMDVAARVTAHVVKTAEAGVSRSSPSCEVDRLVIRPTTAAQERHSEKTRSMAGWFGAMAICTPTYFTSEGQSLVPPKDADEARVRANKATWGAGPVSWLEYAEEWMGRGIDGFEAGFAGNGETNGVSK